MFCLYRLLPLPWIQQDFGKISGDYFVNKSTDKRIIMSIAVFVLFFTPWKHRPKSGLFFFFFSLYFLPRSWNSAGILSKVSTNPVKFGNAARFGEATPEPVLLKSLSGWNMDCFLRAYGPWGLPSHPQMRVTVIQGATLLEQCTIIIVFFTREYNVQENMGVPPGTLRFFDHWLNALISVAIPGAFALFPCSKKEEKKISLVLKTQKKLSLQVPPSMWNVL